MNMEGNKPKTKQDETLRLWAGKRNSSATPRYLTISLSFYYFTFSREKRPQDSKSSFIVLLLLEK
jgi:hypothetical protein